MTKSHAICSYRPRSCSETIGGKPLDAKLSLGSTARSKMNSQQLREVNSQRKNRTARGARARTVSKPEQHWCLGKPLDKDTANGLQQECKPSTRESVGTSRSLCVMTSTGKRGGRQVCKAPAHRKVLADVNGQETSLRESPVDKGSELLRAQDLEKNSMQKMPAALGKASSSFKFRPRPQGGWIVANRTHNIKGSFSTTNLSRSSGGREILPRSKLEKCLPGRNAPGGGGVGVAGGVAGTPDRKLWRGSVGVAPHSSGMGVAANRVKLGERRSKSRIPVLSSRMQRGNLRSEEMQKSNEVGHFTPSGLTWELNLGKVA